MFVCMMEQRTPDTLSSGRFGREWSFLSNPPPPPSHGQARSLPPSSSYIRSDRSSVSPLPTGLHFQHLNASRSSLPRNIYTPSVGGKSSATIPSQPVLIRVNSNVASSHLDPAPRVHPAPRLPRRRPIIIMNNKLPPEQEYSFRSILSAISEDVEEDINAIAEILGRSRLVLADQHDSHLPPTGIIRTTAPLQAVAEASSSTERLAADDVMIVNDEGSLVEGSHSGSAAYGLLERLQALPRRINTDLPPPATRPRTPASARNNSSPAILTEALMADQLEPPQPFVNTHRTSRALLGSAAEGDMEASRFTPAVVSEVWLSAGSDGRVLSGPPVVSEAGRHYPLYSYDESEVFAGGNVVQSPGPSFRERVRRLVLLRDFQGVTTWISRPPQGSSSASTSTDAEARLRRILGRQSTTIPADMLSEQERLNGDDMYA